MNKTIVIVISLLAIGIAGRLIPHLPNATPLAAIALISGTYLGKRWSLVLPLVVLFATDFFIGFYEWRIMASVYISFTLTSFIIWAAKEKGIVTVGFTLLASSLTFFLITNGAVWYFSPWYEKSFTGLLYAYELGIPFFRNMFLGDIIYVSALGLAVSVLTHKASLIALVLSFIGRAATVFSNEEVSHSPRQ